MLIRIVNFGFSTALLFLLSCTVCGEVSATRIKNICEIQGARGNSVSGVGIIVGLARTGDKAADATRAQEEMLRRMGIQVEGRDTLSPKNVAIVTVIAVIPPFAKEGTRIDVQVSSLYDATSLEGGTLMETFLQGVDGEVYAVAQGPVSVGGFNVSAGGSSVQKNHVTAGRIPMGAFVEREIPSTITDGERIMLLLKRPDFGTAENLQVAINGVFGPATASALGAGAIGVVIPESRRSNLVSFIAQIQNINVDVDSHSSVIVNERTGTIVVGGDVMIRPCYVAHGDLTVEVIRTPLVSQPAPLSVGQTVEAEETIVAADEPLARLMPLSGVSAAEVAEGLNRLKVTPRDIITIFQALRQAGVMDADLEIM